MFSKEFALKLDDESAKELYDTHSNYHKGDAGLDLFLLNDVCINGQETKIIDLGIKCQSRKFSWCIWKWLNGEFYTYYSYLLLPRSSISKTPLVMHNSVGLIDQSYLGNIKVPLYNTSNEPVTLKRGDRYVQLVNGDLSPVKFRKVRVLRENTTRGNGGFGSTN